jgi:hypothetical protein
MGIYRYRLWKKMHLNIDLLNAHLKTKNSLLVEKYFVIFNIYSYLLYLAVLSNICDNMVKIRLSFLKIML